MADKLKVKNWAKFQHFKDRKPPWVKLYRDLLDDREWHKLDGDSAKMLVCLWLIGSEDGGELPSVDDLAFRLRVSEKHVEKCLGQLGHWLISARYQDDISESQEKTATDIEVPLRDRDRVEKETEKETNKRATVVASRFEDFWNTWPKSERKQDKSKCAAKWKAQNLDDIAELIIADVNTKKRTQKWQGGFIEAPEVYLNNKRWEDGVTPDEHGKPSVSDPESRAAIEADGVAMGIGPWNEVSEQWHVYKARVRGNRETGLSLGQLTKMASARASA